MLDFFLAYIFTIVIETTLLFALLGKRFPSSAIARNSLIVNTATLPFVWFFFPALAGPIFGYPSQIAVSELFAFGAEALMYWKLFPGMEPKDAIRVSFICNLASFLIGLALGAWF
jgi:hypothetical protein